MSALKNTLIALAIIGILGLLISIIFIPDRDGLHIIQVVDLPESSEYLMEKEEIGFDGEPYVSCSGYADLGIRHKQWAFCKIPTWNYGKKEYVLYTEVDCTDLSKPQGNNHIDYLTHVLDSEEIEYFHELYSIPDEPKLPWWDSWGGKLITFPLLLPIALIGIYLTLVEIGGYLGFVGDIIAKIASIFSEK